MDYVFLPDKIKEQLAELEPGKEPVCTIRCSGGFSNKPGESYIVPFEDKVYLFERSFSENEYSVVSAAYPEVDSIELEQEQFSSSLHISIGDKTIVAKLSCAEVALCDEVIERARNYAQVEEHDEEGKVAESGISPHIGLAVALMHVAGSDDDISDDEKNFIFNICSQDTQLFNAAAEFYQKYSFEDFLKQLELDSQQKLCCVANMLELGMIDGVLHSVEQKVIDIFVETMDVSKGEFETIRNVLLIKNQISVLG
jgi:uncharacterized tellurite resistance protein B-like protein